MLIGHPFWWGVVATLGIELVAALAVACIILAGTARRGGGR